MIDGHGRRVDHRIRRCVRRARTRPHSRPRQSAQGRDVQGVCRQPERLCVLDARHTEIHRNRPTRSADPRRCRGAASADRQDGERSARRRTVDRQKCGRMGWDHSGDLAQTEHRGPGGAQFIAELSRTGFRHRCNGHVPSFSSFGTSRRPATKRIPAPSNGLRGRRARPRIHASSAVRA